MYDKRARQIFDEEIKEFKKLKLSIDDGFNQVVQVLYECTGKVVMMGIGKTGIIAHKIAASFASTGTPAIFVNAVEAVHGDLGMVSGNDVAVLVSNSGSTDEITNIIDPLHRLGCVIVAMTGNLNSPLALRADYVLSIHVDSETCPLGLAPTTSTTATLLMGDALMVCLMEKRCFKAEDFGLYHPGGALGRKILARVDNCMIKVVPRVHKDALLRDVVREMSDKHLGMTMVYDFAESNCIGIITDGDLRRAIEKYDNLQITAADIMTLGYKHIHKDALLSDALAMMDKHNITTLAVTNTINSNEIIGVISIHHIIDFK